MVLNNMNKIYWVIIEVNFDEPILSKNESISETVGFFQTFGCTADTEELMRKSINYSLSKTEWLEDLHPEIQFDISIIDHHDVEREILLDNEINEYLESSPYENGLWYQSGRSYFHKEDDDSGDGYLVEVVPKNMH